MSDPLVIRRARPDIGLYPRFGFRIEGAHRGHALRNAVYADAHAMGRLHPRPPALAWPAQREGG